MMFLGTFIPARRTLHLAGSPRLAFFKTVLATLAAVCVPLWPWAEVRAERYAFLVGVRPYASKELGQLRYVVRHL